MMSLKLFLLLVWTLVALYIGVVSAKYCKEHFPCPSTCYTNASYTGPCKNGTETSNCTFYRMEAKNCTKSCVRQVCCEGFKGKYCSIDINECEFAGCQHRCRNTRGSYKCVCNYGYNLNEDGRTCEDINECDSLTINCSQHCNNTPGSFKCYCDPGYMLDADLKTCVDINECEAFPLSCSHNCTNTPGSFKCSCAPGFELYTDLRTCVDIDECPSANCSHVCHNIKGSFECSCDPGYQLDNDSRTCIPVCYGDTACPNGGTCIQPDVCQCMTGYAEPRCEDINECSSGSAICSHNCSNTDGSYRCYCDPGFKLDTDLRTCVDVNECDSMAANCSQHCNNTSGSFKCYCDPGYKLDTYLKTCVDINECEVSPTSCSHNCTNTHGSFRCSCNPGFELDTDLRTCVDIDECPSANCSHVCHNTQGSFKCSCDPSYQLDNDSRTCIPVCYGDTACPNGGTCIQPDVCQCMTGYAEPHCEDINECSSGSANCSQNCSNTDGSYRCYCDPGFKLDTDLRTCIDINECDSMAANCSQHCNNTRGSFKCYCDPGYKLDTDLKACVDINECEASPTSCSHNCTNTHGSFRCSCNPGFKLDTDLRNCVDIDECPSANCSHVCHNTQGSFECSCDPGYQLDNDSRTCIPLCYGDTGCPNEGTCIQPDMCECKPGYEEPQCEDIDECSIRNGHCDHICINLNGTYTCVCVLGFKLNEDGRTCSSLPVDGGYTQWTEWGPCSMVCGSGVQERSRTCSNPIPEYGGRDCEGSAEDFITCNMNSCLECLPDGTIHFRNPDSSVYTKFTAVYDKDGALTNCTGTADATLDNVYFDCAKTTSTVTIYINHRDFTESILSTKSRVFETQCLWANITSTAGLGSRIDQFTESPIPANNITAGFFSRPDVEVNEARVGDIVYFIMTSPAEFDLFPAECNVTGRGNQYKSIISDGCSKYPMLMTSFILQREHPMKMYNSKLRVFQFYESDTLTVTCDARVCENSLCPIDCGGVGRTRRDITDRFDDIDKEKEEVKTIRISRRLKIINSEYHLSAAVTISGTFIVAVLLSISARLFA